MESTGTLGHLLALISDCAAATDPEQVIQNALRSLPALSGAAAVTLVRTQEDLPPDGRESSMARVEHHALPGHAGILVLAWRDEPERPDVGLQAALASVDSALARALVEEELADVVARVDNAQHLANMGDYDWHIPSDTNRWSDQLYRIYGHEPDSFNPSYDEFLARVHPEDRDRIAELHREAYATGEPYQMMERILRPDGEVRYLASNGEVMTGPDGTPLRFRGTCIDITDRVLAERARETIAARFRGLVESAPDAILVLDDEGQILEANPRAHELLGGSPVGHQIDELVPGPARDGAVGIPAIGLDGSELLLDVTTAAVTHVDPERLIAVFLRDARVRLADEAMAARLGEEQLRRRQVLEINDNVVQGLVAATYALEMDDPEQSAVYLSGTLAAARSMMDDLLDPLTGAGTTPGDLVRSTAASFPTEDRP